MFGIRHYTVAARPLASIGDENACCAPAQFQSRSIAVECDPQDEQVLKLLTAFFQIQSPTTRQILVALTESAARGASLTAQYFERGKPQGVKPN